MEKTPSVAISRNRAPDAALICVSRSSIGKLDARPLRRLNHPLILVKPRLADLIQLTLDTRLEGTDHHSPVQSKITLPD
jgi:hypothetical protein